MSDRSAADLTPASSGTDPIARAEAIAPVLRAATQRIEAGRALPADIVAALNDARLFRLVLPRSLGGDEVDLTTLAKVMEIIATADASTAWCIGQQSGCALAAAYLKPDAARRLFGPADAALAWGVGVQGKAVTVDGGYRVTGKWTFASGSANATLLGGHSAVVAADGTPLKRADGRPRECTALFATSKAMIHDIWHTLGLKGTASNTYEVADLFVPAADVIDRDDPAQRVEPGTLYLFATTHIHAAVFAALNLGIAQGMVGDLMTLALTKTPRGTSSTLRDSALFQSQIAILEARLRASRAYLHDALDKAWDKAGATREVTLEDAADLKLATTYVINQGFEVATEAYRAAGQNAIFPTHPFEQRMRDALTASQQIQGRPSNFTTIGRVMLGLPPDTIILGS